MSNDITLPEAKFGHALDEYYGFLHKLVANSGGTLQPSQRLVTLNTITPFSIVKDKPLYNTFVLRAYADLVVRRKSSTEAGSPVTPPADIVDSANTGDAWSWEYNRIAYSNLLQDLKKYVQDPAVVAKIAALEYAWEGQFQAYIDELDRIETGWSKHAADSGLSEDKNPDLYYREKNDYFRKRKAKVERLYIKQQQTIIEINDLEVDHLDAAGLQLKALKDNLNVTNQVKLPIRPELEDYVGSDPSNSPMDYDRRPAIYPTGTQVFNDLLDTSNDGNESAQLQRGYVISRQKTTKYTHDTDWGASGSARKFLFLKANLSVAEKTHYLQEITKIAKIEVGFKSISDVQIVRGMWYSGSFLKGARFKKWLDAQPEFKKSLQNLIVSVIVCRGLTLKLGFDSDIHEESWRDLKVKGSGGLSIAGWNFGMNGHYNSKTTWDLKDVTKNSVTFIDGPNVCRVIGYIVEQVLDPASFKGRLGDATEVDDTLIKDFKAGKFDYGEFVKRIHNQ